MWLRDFPSVAKASAGQGIVERELTIPKGLARMAAPA
jgi:hypothetical protein